MPGAERMGRGGDDRIAKLCDDLGERRPEFHNFGCRLGHGGALAGPHLKLRLEELRGHPAVGAVSALFQQLAGGVSNQVTTLPVHKEILLLDTDRE